jgi:hypothetical protein
LWSLALCITDKANAVAWPLTDPLFVLPAPGLDPVDVLLLMAASENDTPKVEELLAAGANINIADNKGKSPLDLASKQEVKDLLEVRGTH